MPLHREYRLDSKNEFLPPISIQVTVLKEMITCKLVKLNGFNGSIEIDELNTPCRVSKGQAGFNAGRTAFQNEPGILRYREMLFHVDPRFPPSVQDITGKMIREYNIILVPDPEMPEGILYPAFCLPEIPPFHDAAFFVV